MISPAHSIALTHLGFASFAPHPALSPWVQCYWVARQQHLPTQGMAERQYPDGGSSLIMDFSLSEAPTITFKAKLNTERFIAHHAIDCLGVRFQPGGAFQLLGLSMDDWMHPSTSNTAVPTELPRQLLHPLQAQLGHLTDTHQRLLRVERWLIAQARQRNLKASFFESFIQQLTHPETTLSQILAQQPLGRRQLERKFQIEVGTSPGQLLQLQRIKKARFTLSQHPNISLAQVALHCGFYDQAHFSRHFQRLTEQTPGQYQQRKMSQLYNSTLKR